MILNLIIDNYILINFYQKNWIKLKILVNWWIILKLPDYTKNNIKNITFKITKLFLYI
jgi:hypothetical protein